MQPEMYRITIFCRQKMVEVVEIEGYDKAQDFFKSIRDNYLDGCWTRAELVRI